MPKTEWAGRDRAVCVDRVKYATSRITDDELARLAHSFQEYPFQLLLHLRGYETALTEMEAALRTLMEHGHSGSCLRNRDSNGEAWKCFCGYEGARALLAKYARPEIKNV